MRFSTELLNELRAHTERMRPYFEQQRKEAIAYLSRGGNLPDSKLYPIADGCGCSVRDIRNAATSQNAPKSRQMASPVKSSFVSREASAARLRLAEAERRLATAQTKYAQVINNPPTAVPWMISGVVASEYRTKRIEAEADLLVSKAMTEAVLQSVRRLGG